jgi:archaeosine-15-forming tRNA-guanine transglycosylase
MKERILKALRDAEVPFCLLLPLGVLHAAFVRDILEETHVQVIVPRKCYVFKKGGTEVPFKFLCWLCYKMELKRDLYFID